MKILSGKQFARLLERKGWELRRIKGSHHVYLKKGKYARISVPIHANKSLKIGLQRYMMKLANINEDEL